MKTETAKRDPIVRKAKRARNTSPEPAGDYAVGIVRGAKEETFLFLGARAQLPTDLSFYDERGFRDELARGGFYQQEIEDRILYARKNLM